MSTTCRLQAMMPIIGGHQLQLLSTLQHSKARLLGEPGTHITCVIQHSVSESHIQTMAKWLVPQAHGPTPSQLIMCRWGQLSYGSSPEGLSRHLSSSQLWEVKRAMMRILLFLDFVPFKIDAVARNLLNFKDFRMAPEKKKNFQVMNNY